MANKNFWTNLGDAINYARATSTLDGGGAYYVTSQAKEDLREQGKEEEAKQIEKAEAAGTVGGAIAGATVVNLPAFLLTMKWLGTPAGRTVLGNIGKDMLVGTAGYLTIDEISKALTGKTVGQQVADGLGKIGLEKVPYSVREGIGNFVNPGGWLTWGGGSKVANYLYNRGTKLVDNIANRFTANKNSLFKIAPEYEKFILDHPHLNPNSLEALDQFFLIQGRSTRGINGTDHIEEALTLIGNKTAKLPGYDIQNTNGGLYTSNSPYISKQFSIRRNSSAGDGIISAIGDLLYQFNIDKTLPLTEQLKLYKNSIAFLTDKHDGLPHLGVRDAILRFGKRKAVAFEAPYGINRSNIPTHERIYVSGENPKLINLEMETGLSGDMRQQGAGAPDVKISGKHFYPYELGNTPIDVTTKIVNGVGNAILPTMGTAGIIGAAGIIPYIFGAPLYSWFSYVKPKEETVELSDNFKSGGSIKIKKKNKGKFTDYCGGKVTEECIRKGKNSSNPTIRKRANFAWVARHKFKHADGNKINYLNIFQ